MEGSCAGWKLPWKAAVSQESLNPYTVRTRGVGKVGTTRRIIGSCSYPQTLEITAPHFVVVGQGSGGWGLIL